jgi:hypothetical protein
MIGTTRSRVSYFMNRFRQRGFIEYNGRIPGPQVAAECDSVGPVPWAELSECSLRGNRTRAI